MKEILLKILRRTIRLLVPTMIVSAIVTLLNVTGVLSTRMLVLIPLGIGALLVVYLAVRFSRNNYFKLRNLKLYYLVELVSFIIYTVALVGVYKFAGNIIFTWLFCVTKIASYIHPGIPGIYASLFFDFVIFISMMIAPVGMNFLIMYREKPDADK